METSANHVCPVWLAYTFLLPLRKYQHNPEKILSPYIRDGMNVMDYGCAMGWFSIPMARMTGDNGKVYCVDIQEKMLERLNKRAVKHNVEGVIRTLRVGSDYNADELSGDIDFALLFAVVHEVPDKKQLFNDMFKVLRPGGKLMFAEPKGHVTSSEFEDSVNMACEAGLKPLPDKPLSKGLCRMFIKE